MNENNYYIYVWYIVPTNEIFYIGKGRNNRYKSLSQRSKGFTSIYTNNHCEVDIIRDNLCEKDAYDLEYTLIQFVKTYTKIQLTNQTEGGMGGRGFKPTADTIAKRALATKKKWQDPEYKAMMSEKRRDPSSAYQSAEFKAKISALVSGRKNPNYGKHWSEEQRRASSLRAKESKRFLGTNNPRARRIQCVETLEVFELVRDAMKKYGVKHEASFSVALDNPKRTAAGLHWISLEKIVHKQ